MFVDDGVSTERLQERKFLADELAMGIEIFNFPIS